MEWDHKDEWLVRGENFTVKVSRHEVKQTEPPICFDSEGPHRWCVYAYIYPEHPHFSKFEGDNMWQDAAAIMPFHWGPSFLEYHLDGKGNIGSVQVGADYNHLHDNFFTRYATKENAYRVFRDAEELYEWLSDRDVKKHPEV